MLINDFGLAAPIGATARKGNPYFMPQQVLESAGDVYVAKPAHDLETFVKVLAYGTDQRIAKRLSEIPPEKDKLVLFWRTREVKDRNLCVQLRLAREGKYDELKLELEDVAWQSSVHKNTII